MEDRQRFLQQDGLKMESLKTPGTGPAVFWIYPLGSKGLLYMGGVGNEGNPKLIYSDGESRYIVVYMNGHMVLRYRIYRYLDPRGPTVMGTIRIKHRKLQRCQEILQRR